MKKPTYKELKRENRDLIWLQEKTLEIAAIEIKPIEERDAFLSLL